MRTSNHEALLASVPEASDFTYRKILLVDLDLDRCTVLKSDPEGWQPGEGPITEQLAQFALSGAVHQADAEHFITFTRLDQLKRIAAGQQTEQSMIYRRRTDSSFRWNLLETILDHNKSSRFITLCVKDVDDMFREGAEREGLAVQKQEMINSLEDRAYIISSLSTLFFSTYYINLEQDTFRAINQLSRVGDILGAEVNYTAALGIYANHFVHPDDREEYLKTMSMQNLRDGLRWWQPCIPFEYRRISDMTEKKPDKWNWVRASAVLARTGSDDLPRTAVYVAQDISVSRHVSVL